MNGVSNKKGYLKGLLFALTVMVLGLVLNPLIGALSLAKLIWPQNLYFIIVLLVFGLAIGAISNSSLIRVVTESSFVSVLLLVLTVFSLGIFFMPDINSYALVLEYLSTPLFLLVVFAYLIGGAFVVCTVKFWRQKWSQILIVFAVLLFCFSTVASRYDYYNLSMRIGNDRALFEAEDANGKYYRLPFAVKLLVNNESSKSQGVSPASSIVRIFNTVSDYEDVTFSDDTQFRTKGWVINKDKHTKQDALQKEQAVLRLIFDRWIELKYISLVLLVVSLLLRIRY